MYNNTAEQLFHTCLTSVIEDNLDEQSIVVIFGNLSKEKKRVVEQDGRVFLTINGSFFRAKMFFSPNTQEMSGLVVQVDEKPFTEMRASAKALYMQTTESPSSEGKMEWKKGLLGGKQQLIIKQFLGEPFQLIISYINIFGNYSVHFDKSPLK